MGLKVIEVTERKKVTDYFAFLTQSQNRDHEFFERLVERGAERELKSQQMMCSTVKEIAKIFLGGQVKTVKEQ